MSNLRVCKRALIGCFLVALAATANVPCAPAEVIEMESDVYASLSGFVYCDVDNSGTYNNNEERIRDVLIILDGLLDYIDPDSPEAQAWGVGQRPLEPGERETLQRIAWTDERGEYRFDYVLPGTYSIMEVTPYMFVEGKPNAAGSLGGEVVTSNHFAEVVVSSGDEGSGYNFGEWGLRTKYLSKRSLIVVIPEPSTLATLVGALVVGGILWMRRRR